VSSKILPNTFMSFNLYVDVAMELLTPEEYTVLSYATRHILGWQDKVNKRRGFISLTMFEGGFSTGEGTHFGGTGLGRATLLKALDGLTQANLLVKIGEPTADGQEWELGEEIRWDYLLARQAAKDEQNRLKTEKARSTRKARQVVSPTNQQVVSPTNQQVVSPTNQQRLVPQTSAGLSHKLNQRHLQRHLQNHIAPTGAPASSITDETGLYPCTSADIVALIGAWWDWTPRRPTKRGQVIESKQHFANKTNREYAQNLVQRGVLPADFIRCLGEIRNDENSRLHDKEMTFCYAGEVVEEWVQEDRAENWYTEDAPRITPRKPDVAVNMGEIGEGDNLLERLANDPTVIVDVPAPYISPHEASEAEDDESGEFSADDATLLAELGLPL